MPEGAKLPGPRAWIALLVAPAVLVGPTLLAGRAFLPHLPAGLEPLASEHPEAAAHAMDGANYGPADRVFPVLTDQMAMREDLAAGSLPTWEHRLGLGVPLFAGSIAGAAYPPNWLGFLLPPDVAAAPLAILTLLLGGLGMWLLLARLGLSPAACAVGAIGLELGGFGVANLLDPMRVDAVVWLPWSLWAIEGIVRGVRWSGVALFLSVAFSLLSGFPQIAIFALLAAAAYGLVRVLPFGPGASGDVLPLRRVLAVGAFLALGVLGASLQLLPTLEASRASLRTGNTVEGLCAQSLPGVTALGVVVPELFASPTEPPLSFGTPVAWWLTPADQHEKAQGFNAVEWNTFAGVALVLLALCGLVSAPRRAAFPAAGLVLAFGFAQGWPLVRGLYALPGLDLGAPNRALAVAWILWPWLAALGAEALGRSDRRAIRALLLGSLGLALAALAARIAIDPETWGPGLETTLLERYEGTFRGTLDELRQVVPPEAARGAAERLRGAASRVLGSSLACLLALLAVALGGRRLPLSAILLGTLACALLPGVLDPLGFSAPVHPAALAAVGAALLVAVYRADEGAAVPSAGLLCALVLLVEGVHTAAPHVTGHDRAGTAIFPQSAAMDAVRLAAGDGRVLRLNPGGETDVLALARPNMPQAYDVCDLTPWTVFTPRGLNELMEAIDPRTRHLTGVWGIPEATLLDHPLLDLLRATAVLSRAPLEHPRLTPTLERPGFCVYRRSGALPPARLVAEGVACPGEGAAVGLLAGRSLDLARQTLLAPGLEAIPPPSPEAGRGTIAGVWRPAKNRLDVAIEGAGGGLLVMHEQYAPGWRARVNGEPTEVLRVDHVYRAVPIPPGDVRVETRYAPGSLRAGFALTIVAAAGALLLSLRLRP